MKQDEIKKAVKEALSDKWREDTSKSITALATQMTAGLAAIHTRQDTANGKRFGKSDPGALFPWARVLVELAATPSTPPPTDVLDLTVPAPRVEREMTSRYLGYNRALGREEHEIVIREYVYRPAP